MKKLISMVMVTVMFAMGTLTTFAADDYVYNDYLIAEQLLGKTWPEVNNMVMSNGNLDVPTYMDAETYGSVIYFDRVEFWHCYRNINYKLSVDGDRIVSSSLMFDTDKDIYDEQMFNTYLALFTAKYGKPQVEQGSFFIGYMWRVNGKRIALNKINKNQYDGVSCKGSLYMNINVERTGGSVG